MKLKFNTKRWKLLAVIMYFSIVIIAAAGTNLILSNITRINTEDFEGKIEKYRVETYISSQSTGNTSYRIQGLISKNNVIYMVPPVLCTELFDFWELRCDGVSINYYDTVLCVTPEVKEILSLSAGGKLKCIAHYRSIFTTEGTNLYVHSNCSLYLDEDCTEEVCSLEKGACVTAYSYNEDSPIAFCLVQGEEQISGYIHSENLSSSPIEQFWVNTNVNGFLNVREKPTTSSAKLGKLSPITQVEVIDYTTGNEWQKILFQDAICYVNSRYLVKEKPAYSQNHSKPVVQVLTQVQVPTHSSFVAYNALLGSRWYSPEQVDEFYGYPSGTTRQWQRYLYTQLSARGLQWWYVWALAQAKQESGWNLNAIGGCDDRGLFQSCCKNNYWGKRWVARFGEPVPSPCDWKASIDMYIALMATPRVVGDKVYDGYLFGRNIPGALHCYHYTSEGQDIKYYNDIIGRFSQISPEN